MAAVASARSGGTHSHAYSACLMATRLSDLPAKGGDDAREKIFGRLKADLTAALPDADFGSMSVLDFGAGPRGYVVRWAGMFAEAYATDLRDFSAAYEGSSVRFVKSDGAHCDMPDASVDVVVSHSVLEHVHDLDAVLSDINRVLRPGGYAYLTIAPLYYSPTGLHRKRELANWEHLDPAHPAYLAATPFYHSRKQGEADLTGSPLNKLTAPEFAAGFDRQGWREVSYSTQKVSKPIPEWVDVERFGRDNLLTKGLVYVGQKAAL